MRRGEATRNRLLDETTRLVMRRGFERTSVGTVLRAAKVKKGALYHHFPGKKDLGLAVLKRARDRFLAFLDDALDGSTPLESLDRFFAAALKKHSDSGFVGGCLWGNTALEMSDSSPIYTGFVAEVFDQWVGRIERVIRDGQRAGQIRRDIPAKDLARMVVATVEGGIMLSRLKKERRHLKRCLDSLRILLVPARATR